MAKTRSISSRGSTIFFTEEPHSKYLHSSGGKWPLLQLFSSGLGLYKQPCSCVNRWVWRGLVTQTRGLGLGWPTSWSPLPLLWREKLFGNTEQGSGSTMSPLLPPYHGQMCSLNLKHPDPYAWTVFVPEENQRWEGKQAIYCVFDGCS